MAGRIPQGFIDELIARADIVEVIGSRVALKRAGREYKACCPFHDEKTPSFWVSPDKQFYHCFGCGAHGTALGFLMEYDRLPFPEAVEDLAGRLGLTVPHEALAAAASGATAPGASSEELAPLYALLTRVADQFHANLKHSERAQRYAEQRGLTPSTVERFHIGYAADGWSELLRRFGRQERDQRALLSAGLIIERDRSGTPGTAAAAEAGSGEGYYDRFRDRLMFPIRDTRGRVIGFGGRVLDRGEPKYLNSPETVLFHKGKELYGLYETRLARRALRRLVVVEGYMDVVRLHQAGVTESVATLGTATTAEHLHRAFRLVSEIVFCFDGDRAGRAAAWRALQQALPEARAGRELRFLFLAEGEDPDSLVGKEGGDRFNARLDGALPLSEYLVAQLLEQADVSHADGKAHFVALARPLLQKISAGLYRELLLDRIAAAIGWPPARLQQWLAEPQTPGVSARRTSESLEVRSAHVPVRSVGRGSLVTQAITLVLHFPAAAVAVDQAQREQLGRVNQPGIAVLLLLLEQLRAQPAASMAQTLERWRERPEHHRLSELAAGEPLVPDQDAAARELRQAVARLLDAELRRRLEVLIDKARVQPLDEAEKQELQALATAQSRVGRV
ncbi:MAG TPA: DNA primase [Steroidobacteraceae bacterium]|jgi:DNA primase